MKLSQILALDALTCVFMGVALIAVTPALSSLLALPQDLLFYAGCLLLPIAVFMATLSRQVAPSSTGVWLVILGNVAWIFASVAVVASVLSNALGVGFLLLQAFIVAIFSLAEFKAVSRRDAGVV
jgi:hypothetical protein